MARKWRAVTFEWRQHTIQKKKLGIDDSCGIVHFSSARCRPAEGDAEVLGPLAGGVPLREHAVEEGAGRLRLPPGFGGQVFACGRAGH